MDQVIQMLPEPLKQISTHHDFAGQKRAERIYQVILVVAGVLGFMIGFAGQQLSYTVYTIVSGSLIACAVVLPPWSFFRQNPVIWRPVSHNDEN
ncbi:hypothetical protein QR680_010386 [Steinernema hermaphroditum]|uniref:Signal peptidase complex subunit 1 n=1 Tax=Steinernema hermaphroditum TaxID=289476 RepID=A0AA39MBP2_9BILA|nr:hypothetical protein QR680_010386 [Steinernema hermaphroditum]